MVGLQPRLWNLELLTYGAIVGVADGFMGVGPSVWGCDHVNELPSLLHGVLGFARVWPPLGVKPALSINALVRMPAEEIPGWGWG